MTVVVCIKVGKKYGPEYVNRLYYAVERYTTAEYRFLCLTDDPAGLECDWAPIETDLPGWWAKLVLFKPHSWLARRRVVYLDLDTVIVGNIDLLFTYQGPLAIATNWNDPREYASLLMNIGPDVGTHIWDRFQYDPKEYMQYYKGRGDQGWISDTYEHADLIDDLYPRLLGSYKIHQLQDGPGNYKIIAFHGQPKPHELRNWAYDRWIENSQRPQVA